MTPIARTTPPDALVAELARLAGIQSRRPEVREAGQHLRQVAGGDASRIALAVLVAVASAGMRRPLFDDATQTVNDDAMLVLARGSDCSGLAIAVAALALAAGLPARITWIPGRAQETGLAHVFTELEIDGTWRPADATDPRVARPAKV